MRQRENGRTVWRDGEWRWEAGDVRGAALGDGAVGGQKALEDRVRAAVEEALGGVTLTVPLNVDGMRLGEASIRGINAVTRSTGRVLLKL